MSFASLIVLFRCLWHRMGQPGPVLVHCLSVCIVSSCAASRPCSADMERTGAFLAIDMALDWLVAGAINVPDIVPTIWRQYGRMMVDDLVTGFRIDCSPPLKRVFSQQQYRFVYDLLCYVLRQYGATA